MMDRKSYLSIDWRKQGFIASKDEANNQLLNAKKLYDKLCDYLRERLDMNK